VSLLLLIFSEDEFGQPVMRAAANEIVAYVFNGDSGIRVGDKTLALVVALYEFRKTQGMDKPADGGGIYD